MTDHDAAILVRLTDTDHVFADPADDVRGRTVRDPNGTDLGTVKDLLVDAEEKKVRFLRVESGGVLGIGAVASFIPVETIVGTGGETGDEVRIDQSAAKVAEAPRYDPELVEAPPIDYYESVYTHYGYPPFWGPGYVPPGRIR
jgi:sporulation protein YlmC with PRC-barrel domain